MRSGLFDFVYRYVVINGTANNSNTLYVNGYAGGTAAWSPASDGRLKKDVQTLDGALEKVLKLRGVSYYWKNREEMAAAKGVSVDSLDYGYDDKRGDESKKKVIYVGTRITPERIEPVAHGL